MPSRSVAASTLRASRVASTSTARSARPIGRRTLASLESSVPAPTALSALASRLSLPPNPALHPQLLACLTHPSYANARESETPTETTTASNSLLAPLGNTLLGLFASEHLAQVYPLLPTAALQNAVQAHVGQAACFSIARELGVGVTGGYGGQSQGIPVRWVRREKSAVEHVPLAHGFRERDDGIKKERSQGFEDVVADTVKAFVGLVYQELGLHAARKFTHAYFLSRHLDLTSLFKFHQPKFILAQTVKKYLIGAGVEAGSGASRIETRVLAETGRNTQSPLFNVGLFLPSGLKLAEGFGSSLKMAEHRASVNALLSIFLLREDTPSVMPTSLHSDKAWIGDAKLEKAFEGLRFLNEASEVVAGSSSRKKAGKGAR